MPKDLIAVVAMIGEHVSVELRIVQAYYQISILVNLLEIKSTSILMVLKRVCYAMFIFIS